MNCITMGSIVFTLSFCLNLVAGKNLPSEGSPPAGNKFYLVETEDIEVEDTEVEDTEDKKGDDQVDKVEEKIKMKGIDNIDVEEKMDSKKGNDYSLNNNDDNDYWYGY